MKIRDSHAVLNGDTEIINLDSGGLQVVADDGNTLLNICLNGNVLTVSAGNLCKHGGKTLDDNFSIKPVASNKIKIIIDEYIDECEPE